MMVVSADAIDGTATAIAASAARTKRAFIDPLLQGCPQGHKRLHVQPFPDPHGFPPEWMFRLAARPSSMAQLTKAPSPRSSRVTNIQGKPASMRFRDQDITFGNGTRGV